MQQQTIQQDAEKAQNPVPVIMRPSWGRFTGRTGSNHLTLRPTRSDHLSNVSEFSDSSADSSESTNHGLICHESQSASSTRFPQSADDQGQESPLDNSAKRLLASPPPSVIPDQDAGEVVERPPWYGGMLLPPKREIVRQGKNGKIPIYPLTGQELDELIVHRIIAGGNWWWEGANGIASYLGQSMQGLIGQMKNWNTQKQKVRKLLLLDGSDGNLRSSLESLEKIKSVVSRKLLGGPNGVQRYVRFAEDGGNLLPVDPVLLFRALHPVVSVQKSDDEVRQTIYEDPISREAWHPWPEPGSFRGVVNDSVNDALSAHIEVARVDVTAAGEAADAVGAAADPSFSEACKGT